MSETTSESGQAQLADEPSMEDILDSIRKIIADDDQTMDIAPPQALGRDSAQEKSEGPIFAIEPALTPSSRVTDTDLNPDLSSGADYDENSVFNTLRDDNHDDQDETVDLDIEALLSGAETPSESLENFSAQNFSEEDDLTNMLDIEIPDLEEENVSVAPASEAVRVEAAPTDILDLSVVVSEAQIEAHQETLSQGTLSQDDDKGSLFGQLEGLLANVPQDEGSSDESELNDESDVSLSELDDFAEIEGLEFTEINELEALLDGAMDEAEIATGTEKDPQAPETHIQEADASDSPAFLSDEADMDMVKSLMADLTESEVESDADLEQETSPSSEVEAEIPAIDDILQDVMDDMTALASDSEASDLEEFDSEPDPLSLAHDYDDVEFDDSDILDDIINMSLDAEMAADEIEGEDALQIPEPEEDPLESLSEETENEETEIEAKSPVTAQSLISSLMEIAGAAEQDAEEAEASLDAAASSEQNSENTKTTATETSGADEVAEKSHPKTPLKETADMSKAAVNQDRILDEVSGVAATSAFASLNNIVEEKAVKAERGDRIGDLVMEALRPMLKEWLDEHLNDIVERAVTKEVQRISAGK